MRFLQQLEHRSIVFVEQSLGHLNFVLRGDADQVLVIGAVMDRTEAQAVVDRRLATVVSVTDDVRGIEEPDLLEPADRTLVPSREAHGL